MLVLSRKCQDSILIGEEILVTVLAIQGNKVSLGIDAPREISVHRREVAQRILESPIRPDRVMLGTTG